MVGERDQHWPSRKALIDYLRCESRFEERYRLLQASTVGRKHWIVVRNIETDSIELLLDKLVEDKGKGWHFVSLESEADFDAFNCPLRFVERLSAPTSTASVNWRQKVREHHDRIFRRKHRAFVRGMVVYVNNARYELLRQEGNKQAWLARNTHNGTTEEISQRKLANCEVLSMPVNRY